MAKEEILASYNSRLRVYTDLKETLEMMFKPILSEKSRGIQNTSIRVKGLDSLSNKIDKKDYDSISEITDIVAARVITYFEDDVAEIGQIIANAFEVDVENSVNKSLQLQDDQFGYKSLHYVMQFSEESCKRPEYKSFSGIKFEVQIRSILQHAWAEIEHDLGYKSQQEVPSEIRRRFSRLAGLLELADEEFINIRRKRKEYRSFVEENIKQKDNKEAVEVNLDSIEIFSHSVTVGLVSSVIADIMKVELTKPSTRFEGDIASAYIQAVKATGLTTIEELEMYMLNNMAQISKFADNYQREQGVLQQSISSTSSLYFALYYSILSNNNYGIFEEYIRKISPNNFTNINKLYEILRRAFEKGKI